MAITSQTCTAFICLLVAHFISGCATWQPIQNMPTKEAQVALHESFISALHDTGDKAGIALYKEETTKYFTSRNIGEYGVIFLYKNYPTKHIPGEAKLTYALLNLPQETQIDYFPNKTPENLQPKWQVKFNGPDAGWATGYTDKEPFFSITTIELNDRHKNNHRSDLWFKSKAEMKRFLNALSSLYPRITF